MVGRRPLVAVRVSAWVALMMWFSEVVSSNRLGGGTLGRFKRLKVIVPNFQHANFSDLVCRRSSVFFPKTLSRLGPKKLRQVGSKIVTHFTVRLQKGSAATAEPRAFLVTQSHEKLRNAHSRP